ncbi:MAG TPA: nuclear transport factor 2 family protein [Bdellovibrionota bacterium]|nr:nuclear transport factor 2 family protein [Bdellovibrionota bacterium]
MRAGIWLMGLALVGSVSCAGRRCDVISKDYPDDRKAVAARVHDIFGAAQKKDLAKLESYHLFGPKFSKFDDWEPLARQDAETARKGENEAFSAISDFKYDIHDLKVDVFGPVAVATFTIDYSMKMGKDSAAAKARGTLIFARAEGDWKITHEHFSAFKANP